MLFDGSGITNNEKALIIDHIEWLINLYSNKD